MNGTSDDAPFEVEKFTVGNKTVLEVHYSPSAFVDKYYTRAPPNTEPSFLEVISTSVSTRLYV